MSDLKRLKLDHALGDSLKAGKPILGICNGCQVLVESGIVPGLEPGAVEVGLAANRYPGHRGYYSRWVNVEPVPTSRCGFLEGLDASFPVPIAHAEGRFWADDATLARIEDAWLIVPLIHDDRLLGFVLLLQPRAPQSLNWENLDLLKTVGMQAASYLALSQAAEALAEARQFEGFNRLSAFVIHDLKNPLAVVQAGLSGLLSRPEQYGPLTPNTILLGDTEKRASFNEFAELIHKEFPQMLPLEEANTSRRRFLQLMGASLALAVASVIGMSMLQSSAIRRIGATSVPQVTRAKYLAESALQHAIYMAQSSPATLESSSAGFGLDGPAAMAETFGISVSWMRADSSSWWVRRLVSPLELSRAKNIYHKGTKTQRTNLFSVFVSWWQKKYYHM